ncbi:MULTISPECIES: flavin-containing monooxygenase [Bacillus amyloliquefaciens group]|uniref:flavin-containing monooxygenase n=1 Tax=Bacillus amyloliquefaciens group TaxID=1938374 RepID=UPI00084A0D74|nr:MULTISPECIES: NAD(P)/FAD-dependent oxidoreductase [Bacillus amyloliquefaciens group]AOO60509.1 oxidoreductase [Bacillus velezensis]MCT6829796.1 NAD(P)/FAD-dependent oxidoreductase [Bacillus velezensis]MCT6865101.1 NAD(P)/FAD-dependent oxidoreductase [Bacillus velezensis]QOX76064.1 NAD(P)/FAD-dependent oxidoreductase [Bacillus velezensis]QVL93096.1 NAD(P)/FAD-dependent oxidoreductase [Bacillus velezensis]
MYDTIVIGAGQAGISVGYYLRKSKQKFIILDKSHEVGESWKNRYDSLVLFTSRMYSSLPGMQLEGDQHGLPSKNEIAAYLKKYVERFEIPIQLRTEVISVQKLNNYFLIKTNREEYQTKNLVVAAGPFHTPNIPSISKDVAGHIRQLHSSQYKHSKKLAPGNVLVVGGGNSGAQIAVELSKERVTYLACSKKPVYFPLWIGKRSIFWWFDKLGVLQASHTSILGKFIQKKGDPIFGYELKHAIRQKKIILKQRVIAGKQNEVIFKDSSSLEVNNVIWATGFKNPLWWMKIEGVLDKEGRIIHHRGVSAAEGLYFIGLPWQHRRGSALLQGVGNDAEYIVKQMNGG